MQRGGIAVLVLGASLCACNLPPGACFDDRVTISTGSTQSSGSTATATSTPTGLAFDFGTVVIGSAASVGVILEPGCRVARITSIISSGSPEFSFGPWDGGGFYSYGYGESFDAVSFVPSAIGAADGTITINTTSSQQPIITLTMTGTAVAPGPSCAVDGDCDGGGFCDGRYCRGNACGAFDNVPDSGGGPACAPESHACGVAGALTLVDTLSDPNNCGGCGHACGSGHGCSGGKCGTCANYRIGPEQDFPLGVAQGDGGGSRVWALALGDFDGDGHPDLLIGANPSDSTAPGYNSGQAAWLILNDGNGGFGAAARPISVCGPPLRIGDFNGDCVLDVVAGGAVMLNDGHGNFPIRNDVLTVGASASETGLLVADINRDGSPDLVLASGLLINDGLAGFSPANDFPSGFASFAVGDFNGDGWPDLEGYEARPGGGTLLCYLNDAGDLHLDVDYFPVPLASDFSTPVSSLAAGPLTGTGPDALVYAESGSVIALPSPAIGTSGDLDLGLDGGFYAVAVADLDLDGHADLLASEVSESVDGGVLTSGAGFLDLWTGFMIDADGGLQAGHLQVVPTKFPAGFLQVADVNGDGIPDIVAASPMGSTGIARIMVFPGSCQ